MKRIAIIGAGLAGTACAYVLKKRGLEPVIYDVAPEIAAGASGNAFALYNPRLSAERTTESEFHAAAFTLALRTFAALPDIGWNKCGSLHLVTDEKKQKRFTQCAANWGWPEENMRMVNAREASDIANVEVTQDALWLPDAGAVSPKKLCARYAEGMETHLNTAINSIEEIKADAIILACGMGVKKFITALPLKPVRGQVTEIRATDISRNLKSNLCYGGYVTPANGGAHVTGATFQRWLDYSDIIEQDDADNIRKLGENIPALAGAYEITDHRAAVRATTEDHFPIVGAIRPDLYVSAGHGSHGVIGSIAAAHLIADMILGAPLSLSGPVVEKLSPARYI